MTFAFLFQWWDCFTALCFKKRWILLSLVLRYDEGRSITVRNVSVFLFCLILVVSFTSWTFSNIYCRLRLAAMLNMKCLHLLKWLKSVLWLCLKRNLPCVLSLYRLSQRNYWSHSKSYQKRSSTRRHHVLDLIMVKKMLQYVEPVAWGCISNNIKTMPLHTFSNQVKSRMLAGYWLLCVIFTVRDF